MSLFLLFGCATHSDVQLVTANSLSESLLGKLSGVYPDRFTVYHRVILTVRDKNYDFNGYVNFDKDHMSAVGFNDLGGRLFHITSSEQKTEVLSKPDRMPAFVLRNYVAAELDAIYRAPLPGAPIVRSTGNGITLVNGRRNIEYTFSSTLEHCERITIRQNNTAVSEIQLRDYEMLTGWDREIPRTITVSNQKWHYQMTLRLLRMKSS